MRVAVVGGGVSGLVSAYLLAKAGAKVVVYHKDHPLQSATHDLDIAFLFDVPVTCPNMMELCESLGLETDDLDMSFSVSLQEDGRVCEWGTRNGLSTLFAQKKNALNPYFWKMIREIANFKQDVVSYLEMLENNPDIDCTQTIRQFIDSRGYSELFLKAYLVPMCCSIWSCSSDNIMSFSAFSVLSFCRNHHLLQLFGQPQSLCVKNCSRTILLNKVRKEVESRGGQMRTGCEVHSVISTDEGCIVLCGDGSEDKFNGCIMAVPAPEVIKILGTQATSNEITVLGAFQYVYSDIYLHQDKNLMPQNPKAWSACNFLASKNNDACFTYWMNVLQNIGEEKSPFLVTVNPSHKPEQTLRKWRAGHLIPSVAATKASLQFDSIQGNRGIWFCTAWQGHEFHEESVKAGISAANNMLGKCYDISSNPKQRVPSWMEIGARLFVCRFLRNYISIGSVMLLEEGGNVFRFEGCRKVCSLKAVLKIHSPQFYWKVMTNAELGIADAYINGDFSFVDDDQGLLNFIMILIANKNLDSPGSESNKRRWWSPMLFTAAISHANYFCNHVFTQNSLTQAPRNISHHYDLSNDYFALFLDETMTYSTGIFENEHEDLKVAQMRKIHSLIDKARIEKKHEILEIGSGWGSFAIEVVKRSGCNYTGITLSEEQLKLAEMRVKEAGLQDNIRFLLCDYRQLPDANKYDRIISCEMIEHVGHEYMEEFFGRCESLLQQNGLFVLQFSSIPDQHYDEFRLTPGFITEYMFPGGVLPSLSIITSAMAASSKLCVEHVENIGIHYYPTLRFWRKRFLENRSKIMGLGFDEKFIRTWEYYFDYCAAGFKSRTLGNYQIVFSRPGNCGTFSNPPAL